MSPNIGFDSNFQRSRLNPLLGLFCRVTRWNWFWFWDADKGRRRLWLGDGNSTRPGWRLL